MQCVLSLHSMAAPQSDLRPTLDLTSDKFRCFNHRRQTRQRSTASELQIGHAACIAQGLALFVMYVSQENA